MVVFRHPDNAASPLKWRGARSTALPEMVASLDHGTTAGTRRFTPRRDGHLTQGAIMSALEPLALSPREAAAFLSICRRTLSRLIAARKIAARKDGSRTLVDVSSIKAYYQSLPLKTDHAPIVFGRRAHIVPRSRHKARH
jgi:excisionase family DNA binding protein